MKVISKVRKKGIFREILKAGLLLICFYFYTCLSDVYLFLPPMIGLLFVFYIQISRDNLWILSFAVFVCLIFFEYDHDQHAGILPLVFVVTNWLVIKKFRLLFEENVFFVIIYIALIYLVYFFSLYSFGIFNGVFNSDLSLSFVYYIFYESCLAIIYEKIKYQI
ncbi:hypothetical protein [Helicobacter sp. 13S00477-4]|uniref:hypothetical protein n=1 Tax=Helicobacter sp. 13S00477-4 TaxID=1905759 RepID=UPI000BA6FD2F|nr:hypothetical protein [Helicobacter sp. 13S00477-4]PAF52196.1 hypothetical protein BKH44_03590 [Helicobacter sp. 13S00477-4]